MTTVRLNTGSIVDRDSFHDECARALGFPPTYGRNMDAWIDCLSDLRAASGMTSISLRPDEQLQIELPDAEGFRKRCPSLLADLIDCAAAVNARFAEAGEAPAICIVPL